VTSLADVASHTLLIPVVLKDSMKGHWSVWVDQNWRLTFTFEGGHAIVVDYQDYH